MTLETQWLGEKLEGAVTVVAFTTLTAFTSAPIITGITEGQTDVSLVPQIMIGPFAVTPTNFDVPKTTANFAYRFEKADGTVLDAGLRTQPAAGGMIQPTNNLPLDSDCIFRGHWLGNTLIGPDVVIRFRTLHYTVPIGQTWLIRASGTWVNPVPGGTYGVYAMGGGGGGAMATTARAVTVILLLVVGETAVMPHISRNQFRGTSVLLLAKAGLRRPPQKAGIQVRLRYYPKQISQLPADKVDQ